MQVQSLTSKTGAYSQTTQGHFSGTFLYRQKKVFTKKSGTPVPRSFPIPERQMAPLTNIFLETKGF